jgi:hypothetical protein
MIARLEGDDVGFSLDTLRMLAEGLLPEEFPERMPPLFPNATSPELIYPTLPGNCILLPTVILLLKYAFPVVVAPPEMVSPPASVPFPIVEEAETKIPRVVVGARAPNELIEKSLNCEA